MKTTMQNAFSKDIRWVNAIVLILMAIVTVIAIEPWSAWDVDPNAHGYGWNRFCYFTIQSNFIAVITYIIAAYAIIRKKTLGGWFRYFRAGAVLYMLVTGIVFAILLSDIELPLLSQKLKWKNFILHQFGPFFIMVWWLIWPSRLAISVINSVRLLIFPMLWTIFTFFRGYFIGWYPYPFLDSKEVGGKFEVGLYVMGIAAFFILLSQLLAWVSRARTNNDTLY
ncbi:hypothetical protein DC498_09740 [Terrimonas sp.]|uniref:Pr6Pr family membrane protein n=1 Tax=Terrimonas sp. TaxID=1914338 RepID=UPI000D51B1E9|nr:Pr6Pr family membrane protein [Terrimonas sp.]PVD52384.1 hypothetical protein DC498_09740 [Terrimonas sp.]